MHFSTFPLITFLGIASTTTLEIAKQGGKNMFTTQYMTLVTDDGNRHSLGFPMEGCNMFSPRPDFLKEMCLNRDNREAFITWTDQPGKQYCLQMTKFAFGQKCGTVPNTGEQLICDIDHYTELPCNCRVQGLC